MTQQYSSHWAAIHEKTSIAGIKFLLFIEKYFGRQPFKLVLVPVLLFYWFADERLRNVSIDWLQTVNRRYPFINHEPGQKEGLRHLMRFSETILDKFLAVAGRLDERFLKVENDDIFQKDTPQQGAFILTSHVGCQELLSSVSGHFTAHEIVVLQHTGHAKRFQSLLEKAGGGKAKNDRAKIRWMEVASVSPATAIELADRIENGAYVIIAGDRIPIGSEKAKTEVDFMGRKAFLPTGGALLSLLLHAPLRMMTVTKNPCKTHGQSQYCVRFESIDESPSAKRGKRDQWLQDSMQIYAQHLEREVSHSPFDWFNFFAFFSDENGTQH